MSLLYTSGSCSEKDNLLKVEICRLSNKIHTVLESQNCSRNNHISVKTRPDVQQCQAGPMTGIDLGSIQDRIRILRICKTN